MSRPFQPFDAQKTAHSIARRHVIGDVWWLARRPHRDFDRTAAAEYAEATIADSGHLASVKQWLRMITAVALGDL